MTTNANFSSVSYSPDRLIVGDMDIVPRSITVLSGQVLSRGALIGKTAASGTIAGAAHAGNTGNGVLGSLTVRSAAKEGRYRLVAIEPGANAGVFEVFDPDGISVGTATVAVAFAGPIGFTIADGATDFVSGDSFDVDVSAVVYKYELAALAATDGSATPDLVLAIDCDATAGDAIAPAYATGMFDDSVVIYGTGHTAATVRETLRRKGIHLIATVGA